MTEPHMSTARLQLAVIIGSTRQGRFGPVVANWFVSQAAKRDDIAVDLIDLAALRLPSALGDPSTPDVGALSARLAAADAFVIVTPEYNRSFPASLKHAIDWFSTEWHAKPVGFVSYGGMSGGLRAVEQLRLVFVELHAVTVRNAISFHGGQREFTPEGEPRDALSYNRAAKVLLDQLVWWADALRDARERRPYAA